MNETIFYNTKFLNRILLADLEKSCNLHESNEIECDFQLGNQIGLYFFEMRHIQENMKAFRQRLNPTKVENKVFVLILLEDDDSELCEVEALITFKAWKLLLSFKYSDVPKIIETLFRIRNKDATYIQGRLTPYTWNRKENYFTRLNEVLNHLRIGDTLVVWKLDRLRRSLQHLIQVVNELRDKGIYFKSIQENIDTSSSGGKLIFHIFGALAEFERDVIRDRTMAGLAAARSRGRIGGRPKIMNEGKLLMARTMLSDDSNSINDVCDTLGVSRATLYRYLKE